MKRVKRRRPARLSIVEVIMAIAALIWVMIVAALAFFSAGYEAGQAAVKIERENEQ